jgi:class 3 adenylate cyclase
MNEPWLEVADDRLGRDLGSTLGLTRAGRGRLLSTLTTFARRGREPDVELDPDLLSLLQTIGLGAAEGDGSTRELAALIDRGEAAGLDREALPHILQAYVRAVGRIAAVEAAVALEALRHTESDRRAEVIGRMIDAVLPASLRAFDLLHRAMLHDALLESAEGLDAGDADAENMAVGMVDLVRSTDYLTKASAEELEQLVDAMFAAGQAAISGRAAHIVKYVGDGVFIAANEVSSVADVALEMIARLEADLPLRARGGISHGFVVQRAGDIFGLPVNTSLLLTKAARPGTVLLTADAASLLSPERHGRVRRLRLPHPALGEQRVATLRAQASAGEPGRSAAAGGGGVASEGVDSEPS